MHFNSAPPVVTAPTEISAIERQDSEVILPFIIYSFPLPRVVVYEHNGQNVEFNNRVRSFTNGSIKIFNPSKSDAGEYMLRVINERGISSASLIVHIFCKPYCISLLSTTQWHCYCTKNVECYQVTNVLLGAPEIVSLDGPLVAQFDRTIQIPCGIEVRGHPPPTYKWLYQGVPGSDFAELSSSRFSTDPDSGVLELSVAQYDDSGYYLCNASNVIGSSTVLVNLLVLGERMFVHNTRHHSCVCVCLFVGMPISCLAGSCEISYHCVGNTL